MGLENLSSPFSDISENKANMSDVKSDQIESSYDDVFPNKLNDPNINIEVGSDNKPVSSIASLVNQDVYTGTYSSNFTSLNHVLQPDGTYTPYEPVRFGAAEDSPIGKKLTSSEEQASSNLYSGHENQQGIVVNNVKYEGLINNTENSIRFRHVDGANIGKNNILGAPGSGLELTDIFDSTHGAGSVNILRPAGVGSTKHLDIRASGDQLGFDQPFIVKPIAKDGKNSIEGGFNRDFIPYKAVFEDLIRFGKFYTTSKGLVQLLKENVTNILIGSSPSNNPAPLILNTKIGGDLNAINKTLLPPIPLLNTGFLNFTHQFRDLPGPLGSLRKPFVVEYSQRPKLKLPFNHLGDKPLDSVVFGRTYEIDNSHNKKSKFLGMGGGKRHTSKDKIAQSGVEESFFNDYDFVGEYDDEPAPLENETIDIQKGDFYVRIRDLRDGKFIYFRGYVTGITENITPSFNPTQYIGRSEDVYTYEKGERDLSFNLKVYPANAKEFDAMYEKINRLTSLAYPEYQAEANDSSLIRMKAPFTELYMGHIGKRNGKGQFGFIKSLTYNVPESGDWDALTATPRMFDIAIGYQILSKRPPSLTGKFYPGVYGANR